MTNNFHEDSILSDFYRDYSIRWLPKGWIYQNQVQYCRFMFEYGLPIVDPEAHRIYPEKIEQLEEFYDKIYLAQPKPYTFLPDLTLPSYHRAFKRTAGWQTKLDLAIIACALEHYRLVEGNYPQLLVGLSPKYLKECPHEVFTGEAYAYKKLKQEEERYQLYGVGEKP